MKKTLLSWSSGKDSAWALYRLQAESLGLPTGALAREMVDAGLWARLTCIDPRRMPVALAGRAFDHALLDERPADVDPCGENGEFHSFAFDGPMFAWPLRVETGRTEERDSFVFTDLFEAQPTEECVVHETE